MQRLAIPRRHYPKRGFTLIELMIAVAIVAILAAVAMPSFLDSIRKGRRSEAFAAISAVQQSQERWRGNNSTYSATLSDLGVVSPTSTGYYAIAISSETATGYIVTATGQSGTSQANDAECKTLGVKVLGGNITYGGCGGSCTLTFANTNPCWSR